MSAQHDSRSRLSGGAGARSRRQVIATLGAAVAAPALVHAQERTTRRVGVMMAVGETDPEGRNRLQSFRQAVQEAGWTDRKSVV